MSALAAATIAAPIIGGMIGNNQASADRDAANNARNNALAQFANVKTPTIEEMTLALQNYQLTGEINPEMLQAIQMGPSAMEGVSTDPRLRAEQMSALEAMSGLAQGVPQSGDLAAFELVRRSAAGEINAQNNAVLQNMQQRGMAGSGAELLAKLKNNQSGAEMLQQAQLEQAKAMQQARMQALQSQASMAGSLRGQDYDEASNLAKAKDAIAQFNAQNSQNVAKTNVDARNNAQVANLSNKQNIANANIDTANKQQVVNKNLIQQNFDNQMGLAGARAGQYGQQAGAADTRAGQTAAMWSGIGQGVGTGLAAYGNKK